MFYIKCLSSQPKHCNKELVCLYSSNLSPLKKWRKIETDLNNHFTNSVPEPSENYESIINN